MKIALLSSGDTFTMRFTDSYVKLGYEVHLIVLEPIKEDFNPLVKVYILPFRRPWGGILNIFSLRLLLKKIKPDIFHVFEVSTNGLLGRLSNFHPSLVSVYGADVFDVPKKSWLHSRIIIKNLKHYDWIGSTSHMMAKQILKLHPGAKNLTVTPFGVDTSVFAPIDSSKNNDYLTIGTVKRMNSKYGIDVLIKSFAKAYKIMELSQPEVYNKMRLLIVGEGPKLAEYKSLSKELNIEKVTEFTDFVMNKRIPEYLNKMDIFVAMSRMESESFGVAIVEASSCGIPVVCSNIGGLPEVVIDNITGFLVESENVNIATQKLLDLILDNNLREKMGQAGRNFVQNNYEWSYCLEIMTGIYKKTLNANN